MRIKYISCFILLAAIAVTGCGSEPLKMADTGKMPSNTGVLVVGLHTNYDSLDKPVFAQGLRFRFAEKGKEELGYIKLNFEGKDNIQVINLPANRYHFFQLESSSLMLRVHDSSKFDIKPDTINYIGDIYVTIDMENSMARIAVKDSFDEITQYMKKTYPKMSESYKIKKELVDINPKSISETLTERYYK